MRMAMRIRCTEAATSRPVLEARRMAVQLEKMAASTMEKMPMAIMISTRVKATHE